MPKEDVIRFSNWPMEEIAIYKYLELHSEKTFIPRQLFDDMMEKVEHITHYNFKDPKLIDEVGIGLEMFSVIMRTIDFQQFKVTLARMKIQGKIKIEESGGEERIFI